LELLAQDEIAPTHDEAPLKKLMKDSLRAETCFYNTTSPIIPSSCSSLRGSNGISPNSPKTFPLPWRLLNVGITPYHTHLFDLQVYMGKKSMALFWILHFAFLE